MGEREGGGQGKGGEGGGLKDGTGISSFYIVSSFQFRCLIVIIKLATCSGEPPLPTQPPLPPPTPLFLQVNTGFDGSFKDIFFFGFAKSPDRERSCRIFGGFLALQS